MTVFYVCCNGVIYIYISPFLLALWAIVTVLVVLLVVISPVSAAALRGMALTRGRPTALTTRGVSMYNPAAAAQLQAAALRQATPLQTALPYAT